MSHEKAATTGDTNYLLIYGNKEFGTRAPEEAIDADGYTDQTKVSWNYYVLDDGKWELLATDSPEWLGLQDYMNERDQQFAWIGVPHQAITIDEDDKVVGVTLPEST